MYYNNRGLTYEKLGQQEQAARDYAKANRLGYPSGNRDDPDP